MRKIPFGVRTLLGVTAGFVAWLVVWFGSEMTLSAMWPEGFGVHQLAFQAAIENGGQFTANTRLLCIHLVLGAVASIISGFVAALVSGDHKRAPMVLGVLLVAFGVLKAVMSWPYVPAWFHVLFTALLFPMTMVGGRLRSRQG